MSVIKIFSKLNDIKPELATSGSAAYDLRSIEDTFLLKPFERKLVKTGLYIQLPEKQVALVCPRSGLALKYGITVLNAPGVIDSDYRGEIGVILINLSHKIYEVKYRSKIAQLMILNEETSSTVFQYVNSENELSITDRGTGGFGSTGN